MYGKTNLKLTIEIIYFLFSVSPTISQICVTNSTNYEINHAKDFLPRFVLIS